MGILNDKLKDFKYYESKMPKYLKESYGFKEQFKVWHDTMVGEDITGVSNMDGLNTKSNLGKLYRYLGEDTSEFTPGHIYEVVENIYYQITYNLNGGTGNIPVDDNLYSIGDTASIDFSTLPTPVGQKDFLGWSTNSTATTPEFTEDGLTTVEINGDINLYAIYAEYYLVTYDANGGSIVVPTDNVHYQLGDIAIVNAFMRPTSAQAMDNIFVGWSLDPESTEPEYIDIGDRELEVTGNITLYAIYGLIDTFENSSPFVIRSVVVRKVDVTSVNWNIGDSHPIKLTTGYTQTVHLLDNVFGRYEYSEEYQRNSNIVLGFNSYWFNWMLFGRMNATNTNVGGWTTCELNTGDVSSTTTNMAKIYNWLPDNWKKVIPKVKVLSGTGGSQSSTNTSSSDCYVFLPAECELKATVYSIGGNESAVQSAFKIYDFYRYYPETLIKTDRNNNPQPWWTRSPRTNNPQNFVAINELGNSTYYVASQSNYLTPVFAI